MKSSPSIAALYWLVHDYASRGVPKRTRIALVHSKSPHAVELARFYETVCFNRRCHARVFHSKQDAEAWLNSDQTIRQPTRMALRWALNVTAATGYVGGSDASTPAREVCGRPTPTSVCTRNTDSMHCRAERHGKVPDE
jgi:hypothetical protein